MLGTPGLDAVAQAYSRHVGSPVSNFDIAYMVRQIHATVGCHHGCIHCFASPPARPTVMELSAFKRLAAEFGAIARSTGAPYEFLFLGSATDPSAIPHFATYFDAWLEALPPTSPTRLYTHGWLLQERGQDEELRATTHVLRERLDSIEMINISVDHYSRLARSDLPGYESNVAENIRRIVDAVGIERVRIHVLYPVTRHLVSGPPLISYWQNAIGPTYSQILTALQAYGSPPVSASAELTATVLRIGRSAGLSAAETIARARDAGMPMKAGRAVQLFRHESSDAEHEGLQWYRRKALPRLKETVGLQIFPTGCVRIIDYDGYKEGAWLDGGDPVIHYLGEVR